MPIRKTYWPVIFAAWASLLFFGLLDNIRGPFFSDLIQSFSVNDSKGSAFFAVASFFAFVGSWIASPIFNRFGIVWSLRGGLFLLGTGFGLMGLVHSFELLMVACMIFGVGLGLTGVSQNMAVSNWSEERLRRRLLAGLHALYGLASLTAPLVARPFMLAGWTWQATFMLFASLPLLLAAVTFLLHEPTSELNHDDHDDARTPQAIKFHVAVITAIGSAYLIAEIAVASRFVRFMELTESVTAARGSFYLASFYVLIFVGRLTFLVQEWKKISTHNVLTWSAFLSGILFLLGIWISPWLVVLSGLFMGPFFPLLIDHIQKTFRRHAGLAVARVMAVSALAVVTLHVLMGWLTDLFSMKVAMMLGPIGLLVCAGLLVWEKRLG